MQDVVWQRWLEIWRRVGAELEQAPARLSVRRAELGIALVLTFFFLFAGGLAGRAALIGLVAVAAWAALWPIDETARAARAAVATGEPAPGNDGMLRMVIDAVPEPAAVLDHEGYVIHANRLAEDLFGARRRGGHAASHVAAMSRDPELLAAVDQALVSGRPPPSSCTSACRSSDACSPPLPRSPSPAQARAARRSSSPSAT